MQLNPIRLNIGARKSDLARLQAYLVGAALEKHNCIVNYNFRESLGDKNLNDPLWKMPEKGVFTLDFYDDLVSGKLDCVVHSWKDLPVEGSPQTEIVATLPRADQRDLLLFKKSSLKKNNIRIFSSSPRREYNLKPFLQTHLPWNVTDVEFTSVRGNVQTRVRKMIEDSTVDGLIVAKAALDRLLSHPASEFTPTKFQLREHLDLCQWIVLPLSENPNAAAQGALAIEIKKDREDLKKLFAQIHCEPTALAVQTERRVFSSYGGGCHQKIGVAVLERPYGQILTLKGLSPQGEVLNTRTLANTTRKIPTGLVRAELNFTSQRTALDFSVDPTVDALWIARTDDTSLLALKNCKAIIWSAGLHTWKKLADMGIWVHGSAESLGEDEDPQISVLCNKDQLNWATITHQNSDNSLHGKNIAAYQLDLKLVEPNLNSEILSAGKYFFYWKSFSQFKIALAQIPQLKDQYHACGPGKTFKAISQEVAASKLFIYLSEEDWKKETIL